MGIFSGCLLACDIDGTLLADGFISPRNIEKIKFFVAEGGRFSLATGRTVGAVDMILRQIDDISPSVVANGSMIYDYTNKEIVSETVISRSDYFVAEKILSLGLNIGIEAHSGTEILTLHSNRQTRDHQIYEELESVEVSFSRACEYKWNKVVYLFDRDEDVARADEIFGSVGTTCDFVHTSAEIFGEKRNYIEQIPAGISKASALLELSEILKIDKGSFYAIGDYYNDLEMLKKADISAAVLDAPEDIKKYVDFVAGSCKDGAVADFIDYLYSKRKEEKNGHCN